MGSEGDQEWSWHARWRWEAGETDAKGNLRGGLAETLTKCEVLRATTRVTLHHSSCLGVRWYWGRLVDIDLLEFIDGRQPLSKL